MADELLDDLEAAFPIKREVHIDGLKRPVWVWRLSSEQLMEVAETPHDGTAEVIKFTLKLVGYAVGDESSPGLLGTDRGQAWLMRNPKALLELGKVCREFNELGGPSDERKKKSAKDGTP